MAYGEVVHPTTQDRVDKFNYPIYWLRLKVPEYSFELL